MKPTRIRGRSRRLPSPGALSTTQAVVLQTLNDPLMAEQGWGYSQLQCDLRGVKFSRATLRRLVGLGLVLQPSRDSYAWRITAEGSLLVAEMEMNSDSRISRPGENGFSWERREALKRRQP